MAFDPYDWYSFYFGKISRNEASETLEHAEIGTFLIRDSSTSIGDYSLDVRENERVSHYLIQRLRLENGEIKFQIGDQTYPDVPTLLNFYKTHFMESTQLICPAKRELEEVLALHDFHPQKDDELPFKRGDKLWVLNRDEDENWWTVKNGVGKTGQIPANYVCSLDANGDALTGNRSSSSSNDTNQNRDSGGDFSGSPSGIPVYPHNSSNLHNGNVYMADPLAERNGSDRTPSPREQNKTSIQRKLPAWAKVTQDRTPNAYDKTQLRLRTGERILVTKITNSGTWEGELSGKSGKFPMTYIEFLDEDNFSPSPVAQMAELNIK